MGRLNWPDSVWFRHRKVGSLLASRSSSPSSSPLQPDRAGRRRHPHDQSERSSDEDEKSLLFAGGGCRKGSWGDVGEARRAAGRTVESSKNEFLACRTVCSFEFLVSPLRGRNDLSRRVENGFDWIQEKKKASWRRETERKRILGKISKKL